MRVNSAFRESLPEKADRQCADALQDILTTTVHSNGATQISIAIGNEEPAKVVLTRGVAKTFWDVLRLISNGQGFELIPYGAELTTQQAADMLFVSRPYLIKLLEQGDLAYTRVGRHRRIKAEDLFAYKKVRDAERDRLMTELIRTDAEHMFSR